MQQVDAAQVIQKLQAKVGELLTTISVLELQLEAYQKDEGSTNGVVSDAEQQVLLAED